MSVKPYYSTIEHSFLYEDPPEFVYYTDNSNFSSEKDSIESSSVTDIIMNEKDTIDCYCIIL